MSRQKAPNHYRTDDLFVHVDVFTCTERRRREAISAATCLTEALVDHLNVGYENSPACPLLGFIPRFKRRPDVTFHNGGVVIIEDLDMGCVHNRTPSPMKELCASKTYPLRSSVTHSD